MCGIIAYLGKKVAQPILIEGLKRLEYRGYDSAGVALLGSGAGIRGGDATPTRAFCDAACR